MSFGSINLFLVLLALPYKNVLQNSGLHNPLRKLITIKYCTQFSNYFIVSKFLTRWMGLMKLYLFPNVWPEAILIIAKRTTRSEGPTSSSTLSPLGP
jgi:hypothetical protein